MPTKNPSLEYPLVREQFVTVKPSVPIVSFQCYSSGDCNIYMPPRDSRQPFNNIKSVQQQHSSTWAGWCSQFQHRMLFAKCFRGFPREGVEGSTFTAIPTKLGKQHSPPYVPWLGHTHVAGRKGPASSQDLHLRKEDCFVPLQNLSLKFWYWSFSSWYWLLPALCRRSTSSFILLVKHRVPINTCAEVFCVSLLSLPSPQSSLQRSLQAHPYSLLLEQVLVLLLLLLPVSFNCVLRKVLHKFQRLLDLE